MTQLVSYLTKLSKLLDRVAMVIACSALTLMVLSILYQIIARYIFFAPPAWTAELARYAMIWTGFSAATVAYRRNLDPVLFKNSSLPKPWMRKASQWLECLSVALFCGTVLYATPQFLSLHDQRVTEAMEIPSNIVAAIIPISFSIILFHAIVRALTISFARSDEASLNLEPTS